jgi:hypothetical protein
MVGEGRPSLAMTGEDWDAWPNAGDSQPIAGAMRIANVTTMVHDRQEVLRHRRNAAPFASIEQGDRRMTSGGLDARAR